MNDDLEFSPMKYRPEIDGLRAVAILPVVLFHAGMPGFSGGFVGVDVFFVISGYLITSIIHGELQGGGFSFVNFYKRRMRRIFPALFVMLAVSFVAALVILPPSELQQFSDSLVASTFFYSNIYFLHESGYFATAAELTPLLHTWSLAVEEQFYFIFPAMLFFSWRLGHRGQMVFMALVAVASLVAAQVYLATNPTLAFFVLPTRFWELLLGALAAYLLAGPALPGRGASGLSWLGLAMILAAVFGYSPATPFPGVAALLPTLGAVLVILTCDADRGAGRLLAWRGLVMIGLFSYSLYLWHYPMLSFMRHFDGGDRPAMLAAAVAASALAAYLSFRFVEVPVRRSASLSTVRVYASAAAAMLVLLGIGLAGSYSSGFKSFYVAYRLDDATRKNYELYAAAADRGRAMNKGADDGACVFRFETLTDDFVSRFDSCARDHGKATVMIGDSHAINIHNALFDAGVGPFFVTVARGGCRPYQVRKECSFEKFLSFVAQRQDKIGTIIFVMSGAHFVLDHMGRDDSQSAFVPGNAWSFADDSIAATIAYLARLPKGPKVIWLGPYAEARVNLKEPSNFSPERLHFNPQSLEIAARLDARLKQLSAGQHGYTYVSALDALKFNRDSLVQGDCLTFQDEDHLSACGEKLFGPVLAAALGLK